MLRCLESFEYPGSREFRQLYLLMGFANLRAELGIKLVAIATVGALLKVLGHIAFRRLDPGVEKVKNR